MYLYWKKGFLNLFMGAEDAKDRAELLEPTTDTVTYKDRTEEVYGSISRCRPLMKSLPVAAIGKMANGRQSQRQNPR